MERELNGMERKVARVIAQWKTGVFLHLGISGAYLCFLWGYAEWRQTWIMTWYNFMDCVGACLPLAGYAILLGFVSIIFLKKSDSVSGWVNVFVVLPVHTITVTIWQNNGFFLFNFIGLGIVSIIAMIPGFVMTFAEIAGDKKNIKIYHELKELATQGAPQYQYEYAVKCCKGAERIEWLEKAIEQGYEKAEMRLEAIRERMERKRKEGQ